jgi:acyl-CoA thioesterase FadM
MARPPDRLRLYDVWSMFPLSSRMLRRSQHMRNLIIIAGSAVGLLWRRGCPHDRTASCTTLRGVAYINSFVRLPLLAIRQYVRPLPRIGVLDEDRVAMRVWPNDIDFNFHLNNSRYLTYMDYGRIRMLAAAGILGFAVKRRWTPLVGSIDIVYRRSLPLWTPFTMATRTLCWDERWLYMEQTLKFQGGLASIAWVKALFQERGKNIPPQTIVDMVQPGLASPPVTESMMLWNEMTREKLSGN